MRIESDSLGQMELPDGTYYGIQTQRAALNFAVSGIKCSEYTGLITSIAGIKKAAALANCEIGVLAKPLASAICSVCDEIIGGALHDEFCIDVFQGGGWTSANMNANEVIANRASELLTGRIGYHAVHPNDHVNLGQSTNDVIPSAMKIGFYLAFGQLLFEVERLSVALRKKQEEFKEVIKIGRTCLQDAVPLTLGQEFGGYASLIERQFLKLTHARKECLSLPLGGTAVGTGLCAYDGYHERVFVHIREIFKADFVQDTDLFDGMQNADVFVSISVALKSLAVSVSKIASDFRLLSSGPNAGLGEITLPALQPGSSIMPGKINPVLPELINQIAYQVCGNDVAVTMAAESGELDLNVWESVFIKNIFESIKLLTNGLSHFTGKCVTGIQANKDVCRKYAESGVALATVVGSLVGYQAGAESAFEAASKADLLDETGKQLSIKLLDLTDKDKSGKLLMKIRRGTKSDNE